MAQAQLNLPDYLRTPETWARCVKRVDTLDKYKLFAKILMESSLTVGQYYKVLKKFEKDCIEEHGDQTFIFISITVEQRMKDIYDEIKTALSIE